MTAITRKRGKREILRFWLGPSHAVQLEAIYKAKMVKEQLEMNKQAVSRFLQCLITKPSFFELLVNFI